MQNRLQKLRKLLTEQNLDAILISSVPNIIYLTGYAGFSSEERDAFVFITQQEGYIFTHALYAETMGASIPHLKLLQFTREKRLTQILTELVKKHTIKNIGIEENNMTVSEYKAVTSVKTVFSSVQLENLREIKEKNELDALEKACKLTDECFASLLKKLKPGITEKSLEKDIELFFIQNGASTAFRSVVAFGKNTSVPHHLAGETILQKNDCVLIDFGAKVDNYCADVSRTFFLGKPSRKQKDVYETVRLALQEAVTYCESLLTKGQLLSTQALDKVARDYISSKGYPEFPHLLGHGVGLEVHETPHLSPIKPLYLEDGMTFTMEPGIYLPGEIGVRIEDVFTIQQNKLIQLTNAPKELIQL